MSAEIHYRSETMVEKKSIEMDEHVMTTRSTVTSISPRSAGSDRSPIHSMVHFGTTTSRNTVDTLNSANTIPEHNEINIIEQVLNSGLSNGMSNGSNLNFGVHGSKVMNDSNSNNGDNTPKEELSDDNIDEQLYSYNLRPITFVIVSMAIIYGPILILGHDDVDTIFQVHIWYLIANVVFFLALIPLWHKCVPGL